MNEQSTQMIIGQVLHLYVARSLQLYGKKDIKAGQGGMLLVLNKHDGVSQRELADRVGVKPPSITVMLKKMEHGGNILRCPDEKDQRVIRIFITDKGRQLAVQMEDTLKTLGDEMFQNMTKEEILLFRRLLLQVKDNLAHGKEKDWFPCLSSKTKRKDGNND